MELVQTVLGTQGLPQVMGLPREEIGDSSDAPALQLPAWFGPIAMQANHWLQLPASPSAEIQRQMPDMPISDAGIGHDQASDANDSMGSAAVHFALAKAPPGELLAFQGDVASAVQLQWSHASPSRALPVPARAQAGAIQATVTPSGDEPPPGVTAQSDRSGHAQSASPASAQQVVRQPLPPVASASIMASPNARSGPLAPAVGVERHAALPPADARPDAAREPVRIHAEWSDAGVRLWLGMDAHMLAQVDQISAELQKWLAREGIRVLSMACNGKPLLEDAEPAQLSAHLLAEGEHASQATAMGAQLPTSSSQGAKHGHQRG
ncbi:MAG TPA: hypothetical protein VLJ58_16040 [Ramlibacter sp.]|nr:hypothetical protein [Ramlibacter sp.]